MTINQGLFNAQELRYRGPDVSASDACEQANYHYTKMAMEELRAGREIPIQDIPAELGDVAYESVDAGDKCLREAKRTSFMLSAVGRLNYDRIFRRK